MAKMAFQHQAGTAMECLSVSGYARKNIFTYTKRIYFFQSYIYTYVQKK